MTAHPSPLPVRVPPREDESFPGYLGRVSQAMGTPIGVLTRPASGPEGRPLAGRFLWDINTERLQVALARYFNLTIWELQGMLPQYSLMLSDPLEMGTFGPLSSLVRGELAVTSGRFACPECRSEWPDLYRLSWLIRTQVVCLTHGCSIQTDARRVRSQLVGPDEVLAQTRLNQIAESRRPDRAVVLRGVAAYLELLGRRRIKVDRSRWLRDALQIVGGPDAAAISVGRGSGGSPVMLALEAHELGLFNGRYHGQGELLGKPRLPAVLPIDTFAGSVSDLAYPADFYLGRHFAGLACRGESPLDISSQYSFAAVSAVVPEYLRMCVRLDVDSRWDDWCSVIGDVRGQLLSQDVDYARRRELVGSGVAAEMVRPLVYRHHTPLLRAWLNEWAGIYQHWRPNQDVLDGFDRERGHDLARMLARVERRAAA